LSEDEFKEMWRRLKTDLPNSFRFTGTKSDALAVREIFKQRYIPAIESMDFEGKPVEPPKPVEAFPDELVWDMKTHKKIVRRHAPFADFQKFLVAETTAGNISRQEVVSMIPPHFLDVKPGMVVLDMCAAPGSKSAQLAEMIHGDEEERVARAACNENPNTDDEGDYSDDGRSTGLLIANDTDYKRAGMLVHQVKRLNFPNLIVTQHDASILPSIELPTAEGEKKQYLKFDRILADVPCSGDGTARKNPNVWTKWTPKDGLGLHDLQKRILVRGLQLLKKGGRLVYSTCSMNPVENEAVVASAIKEAGGVSRVQLVDCADTLPKLKRKPGLNTWKVFDTSSIPGGERSVHSFTTWEKFSAARDKYAKEDPERQFSSKISSGCFPPKALSEEERIPLEHCVRVYPHLQDTGGFFVAVLEKLDDIKFTQIESKKAAGSGSITPALGHGDEDQSNGSSSPLKRKLDDGSEAPDTLKRTKTANEASNTGKEDVTKQEDSASANISSAPDANPASNGTPAAPTPRDVARPKPNQTQSKEYFEYLPSDDPTISKILTFFGISPRFPRDRFMVKNKEGLLLNKIYYTSALAKAIISQNKSRGVKFIHCGVVMFVSHRIKDAEKMDAPWRLQNEGIRLLEPWASQRIVECTSMVTLKMLLMEMFPKLPKDGTHELREVGEQLMKMDVGCCFVRIEKGEENEGFPFRMVLPLWRHPGSANLMVDKDDRKAMLLRLFNEKDPEIKNHVAEKAKREAEKEAEAEAEANAEGAEHRDMDETLHSEDEGTAIVE